MSTDDGMAEIGRQRNASDWTPPGRLPPPPIQGEGDMVRRREGMVRRLAPSYLPIHLEVQRRRADFYGFSQRDRRAHVRGIGWLWMLVGSIALVYGFVTHGYDLWALAVILVAYNAFIGWRYREK